MHDVRDHVAAAATRKVRQGKKLGKNIIQTVGQ